MSMCVVHMQKMKMSALGGIQSHNQREHESRKNKDIDYTKSSSNYDTVTDGNLNYQRAVKERIAELDLKKAVRKDAVVYCSFIVSSDKAFFDSLAQSLLGQIGTRFEGWTIRDYEIAFPERYDRLIKDSSRAFFESVTEYFKERYGAENVINATVHLDEHTPHMHLGIVPVTTDGRLSAKDIFTPLELKQLQTDFAEKVGQTFRLERGKEGRTATHLDELSFKVQKSQEALRELEIDIYNLEKQRHTLKSECKDLEKSVLSLNKTILGLKTNISTLDTQKRKFEALIERLKGAMRTLVDSYRTTLTELKGKGGSLVLETHQSGRALEFIYDKGLAEQFNQYCVENDGVLQEIESVLAAKPIPSNTPFKQGLETELDLEDDDLVR